MKKTELNAFRNTLKNKQAELENGYYRRGALVIETCPDELDRIQRAQERDLAIGNLDRNSKLLREVRAALSRIDAGAFGICTVCAENIHLRRLSAVAWASSCIACQEAADRERQVDRSEIDIPLGMAA